VPPIQRQVSQWSRPEAPASFRVKEAYQGPGVSTCKDRWVAIAKGIETVYAQWEDAGPFRTDHWNMFFGQRTSETHLNRGAGLDVSPAVRDYLGLNETDVTDCASWSLAKYRAGPWSTLGENNTFVISDRKTGGNCRGVKRG